MINIATLCDKNYLAKGLAMRQSLIDLGVDYFIYWLCIDVWTRNTLIKLDDDRIKIFSLPHLEIDNEDLDRARNNPPSKYGSQRDNYIWSLTPYFINLVLKRIDDNDHLMYVDSDIQFFQSPQIILDVIGDRSIGIHTHRFPEEGKKRKNADEVGKYNVGVTVFKKDEEGLKISRLWRSWCLDISNKYHDQFGSCGDQGYLGAFALETDPKNICIFDEEGPISHLAPWCTSVDGKPIIFFHFSHFVYDLERNEWNDNVKEWSGGKPEWKPSRHPHIKPYYERYFEKIKQVSNLI